MEFKYSVFVNLTVNIILVTRLRASRFLKKIKIQLKGLSFFLIVALAVSLFFNMNIYLSLYTKNCSNSKNSIRINNLGSK
jgi:hypothetical protein